MFRKRHSESPVPQHIAIIMDGNGRWAQRHGLPRSEGHRRGMKVVREIIRAAARLKVGHLTLYAFSSENWKRPKEEVAFLMKACETMLRQELTMLLKEGVRLRHIGREDELPVSLQQMLANAARVTRDNRRLNLQLAFNYGARREIVDAVRKIAGEVKAGRLAVDAIDERTVAGSLYTADIPDPDLLVRTSGEMRISNFLLWQICYAEIYVTRKFWPDFSKAELERAICAFQKRHRRFGGLHD
jgi:undecaprenyl diphosphate synthase